MDGGILQESTDRYPMVEKAHSPGREVGCRNSLDVVVSNVLAGQTGKSRETNRGRSSAQKAARTTVECQQFKASHGLTRGRTLPELIAPDHIVLLAQDLTAMSEPLPRLTPDHHGHTAPDSDEQFGLLNITSHSPD